MARKPMERTARGQFRNGLKGLDEYADKVAKELCEKYPDVDIIDIEILFMKRFEFSMAREMIKYGSSIKEN